jgi:hypothetical protein
VELIIILAVLVLFGFGGAVAGVDSRDGFDWLSRDGSAWHGQNDSDRMGS